MKRKRPLTNESRLKSPRPSKTRQNQLHHVRQCHPRRRLRPSNTSLDVSAVRRKLHQKRRPPVRATMSRKRLTQITCRRPRVERLLAELAVDDPMRSQLIQIPQYRRQVQQKIYLHARLLHLSHHQNSRERPHKKGRIERGMS